MQVDWELSRSFTSDGAGMRDVCGLLLGGTTNTTTTLIAGNDGGALTAFSLLSSSNDDDSSGMTILPFQHNHAITSVVAVNPTTFVTGCKDSVIRIFENQAMVAQLEGHTKNVSSLAVWDEHFLVSGSWDGTAKVWNLQTKLCLATLSGHENSTCVAVVGMIDGVLMVATGSAGEAVNNRIGNHAIRLWTVDTVTGITNLTHTVKEDHNGPIRALYATPNYLLSCSNDGTVKLRDRTSGVAVQTLASIYNDHPPMLLSVTAINQYIIAGAEDGTVLIWNLETDTSQAIPHAACVWNVRALATGDFATCCQDGNVYIFTQATERMATPEIRQSFQETATKALQKQTTGPSADEVAKLPDWNIRTSMLGRSEGQVQLFRKDDIAIAAQWSVASGTWIEVGQVMGARDTGMIDGVQYDHVLPIEVDQTGGGVARLQIGYNNGENPFVAAQRFIDAHVLPQYHLSEIADYIQQRVGHSAPTLGAPTSSSGVVATTGVPLAGYEHIPAKAYKTVTLTKDGAAVLEKMKAKIQSFNRLQDDSMNQLSSLMVTLSAQNLYHSTTVTDEELKIVGDMLRTFPVDECFPALDLARLLVLHPDAASETRTSYWRGIIQQTVFLNEKAIEGPAIPMLSLRLFANAFKGGPGSLQPVRESLPAILACTQKYISSPNKNVRMSVATVLYNVAFYMHSTQLVDMAEDVVPLLGEVLSNRSNESEAVYRTLVALGTVVMASKVAKEAAQRLYLASKVEPAASPHTTNVKAAAKEVYNVLA